MPSEPYNVVKDFEAALCEYTGAKYAVTTNSCTNALLLCLEFMDTKDIVVNIPRLTYVGVAQAILNAGGKARFRDEDWHGTYYLKPYKLIDAARRFTSKMYVPGTLMCVSFHASKILGDTQGGAILLDNAATTNYLKRMRFDGRTEGVPPNEDTFIKGHHCYMSNDVAARLLLKLYSLPKHNEDLPRDDYADLSQQEIFK